MTRAYFRMTCHLFVQGMYWLQVDSLYKEPVMYSFDVIFVGFFIASLYS